jgi:hypothetical protein
VENLCHIHTMAKLAFFAATVTVTLPSFAGQQVKPLVVYHDGTRMLLTPQGTGTHRMAKYGRWDFGERLKNDGKLREKRLNLYVVLPGGQYRSMLHRRYNHTLVINKYTNDGRPRGWDIFWCLVLDPKLRTDLRSEHDILDAAQHRFRPGKDYKLQRAPSHTAMAEQLNVKNVADLRRFRHKDGTLPRLVIVPAHLAVRATTTKRQPTKEN